MKKNVSIQEAHIRTLVAIILLLLALFIINNAVGRILFAVLAAILAGTAFFHTCPLYTLMDKSTREQEPEAATEPTNTPPALESADMLKDTVPEEIVEKEVA